MAVLHDNRGKPERRGRAQNRSLIMGVGDLIEHRHEAGRWRGLNGVFQIEQRQGLTQQCHALVNGTGREQTRNGVRGGNGHTVHTAEG